MNAIYKSETGNYDNSHMTLMRHYTHIMSPGNNFRLCLFCLLVSVNYYLHQLCSFSSFSAAAVKKLRAILNKFIGLLPNTEKNVLPSSPSFTMCICHQSPTQVL